MRKILLINIYLMVVPTTLMALELTENYQLKFLLKKIASGHALSTQEWSSYNQIVSSQEFAKNLLTILEHSPNKTQERQIAQSINVGIMGKPSLENENNTFANFDTSFHDRLPEILNKVRRISALPSNKSQFLFLHGPPGVGKTHLLSAAAHGFKLRNKKTFFVKADQLYNRLSSHYGVGHTGRFYEEINTYDAIIIDDLNATNGFQKQLLSRIFLDAWDKGGMKIIISSNMAIEDFAQNIVAGKYGAPNEEKQRLKSRIETMLEGNIIDFSDIPSQRN